MEVEGMTAVNITNIQMAFRITMEGQGKKFPDAWSTVEKGDVKSEQVENNFEY